MRTTTIEVDLFDRHSINRAIKELKAYKKDFQSRVKDFAQCLAENGYDEIRIWIDVLGANHTENLKNSMVITKNPHKVKGNVVYYVVCEAPYAMFVEFGTGQLGKLASYPYKFPRGVKWKYDIGQTIHEGKDGWRGWYFPLDNGEWRWTNGQASRPFMANGFREMTANVEEIARRVFG